MTETLATLRRFLDLKNEDFREVIQKAGTENPFFTESNMRYALNSIVEDYLDPEKIEEWLTSYGLKSKQNPKRVGLIMAGNIPLVGFHDLLCVLVSGHRAVIKLSSKDKVLPEFVIKCLEQVAPELASRIEIAERLNRVDAIIATGSDNSSRYFEYYFGALPHVFRRNRNGIAVLSGDETQHELELLADDAFLYFGLGCRNVSKVFLPKGYDPKNLFDGFEKYARVTDATAYHNNFQCQHTIRLMNRNPFLSNGFAILEESQQIASAVAVLHYEFYPDIDQLRTQLHGASDKIQCIVSKADIPGAIALGTTQRPQLWDYADGVDTIEFLNNL